MFELLLPYVFASMMGIAPEPVTGSVVLAQAAPETTSETMSETTSDDTLAIAFGDSEEDTGFGDEERADMITSGREPEDQTPTGKYTTALEIKAILGMTKTSWVAVRLYEGNDLVYFSHLLAWRCGLWEIRYGLNGAPADTVFEMEPCNEQFATPNVMNDMENFPLYITLPPESVESVYIEIDYDDGTTDFVRANRGDVLIP